MTYFADLSEYAFGAPGARVLKNVGWLDDHHEFPIEQPRPKLLDAIWEYGKILVVPTRGLHSCAFCTLGNNAFVRHDTTLILGSGEIRVFSATGGAYAAPNMIYHYIFEHHYRPPAEFLEAIEDGPPPGSDEYIELLDRLKVSWRENLPVVGAPKTFRFAQTGNGVEAQEVPAPTKK